MGNSNCRQSQANLHRLIDTLAPQLPEAESSEEFSSAINAQVRGDFPAAISGYQAILCAQPSHGGAMFSLGVLHLTIGDIDYGVSLIERAIQRCPDSLGNSFHFGRLLSSLGRNARAVPKFLTVFGSGSV